MAAAETAAVAAIVMAMAEGKTRGRGQREGLGVCRRTLGFHVYNLATIWYKVEQCF